MKQITPFAVMYFVILLAVAFFALKQSNFWTENKLETDVFEAQLRAGLNQKVDSQKISITPTAIVEDSRCPIDATCVQAGTTRVLAKIVSDVVEKEYVLPFNVPVAVGSLVVTLTRVTPAPRFQYKILATEYRFTFQVSEKGEF